MGGVFDHGQHSMVSASRQHYKRVIVVCIEVRLKKLKKRARRRAFWEEEYELAFLLLVFQDFNRAAKLFVFFRLRRFGRFLGRGVVIVVGNRDDVLG
jgi:hypothetical protein